MSYFWLYFYFYTKSKKGGVVIHICICYPLGYSSIGQEKVGYTLLKVGLGFFPFLATTRIVTTCYSKKRRKMIPPFKNIYPFYPCPIGLSSRIAAKWSSILIIFIIDLIVLCQNMSLMMQFPDAALSQRWWCCQIHWCISKGKRMCKQSNIQRSEIRNNFSHTTTTTTKPLFCSTLLWHYTRQNAEWLNHNHTNWPSKQFI